MENASQVPTTAPEPSSQDGLQAASQQFPDAQPWGRVGGSAYNMSPPKQDEVSNDNFCSKVFIGSYCIV